MRVLALVASFATTAILFRALSLEHYGVWSLLISIQAWISLFDLGIGNGLRTKVAECLARERPEKASRLISLAYAIFSLITIGVASLFLATIALVDWQQFLNVYSIDPLTLIFTVAVAGILTLLVFISNLINPVVGAAQKSSYTAVTGFAASASFGLAAFLLYYFESGSVLSYLATQGLITIAANIALSVWFYRKRRELMPQPTANLSGARSLVSLSASYFVIQASMLMLYTTDRFMVAQTLGPDLIPQYDAVFKLFSFILTTHVMINSPMWSAYTEAYNRGEARWILTALKKQVRIVLALSVVCAVLVFLTHYIVDAWAGGKVKVSTSLPYIMCAFAVLTMWNNMFGVVLLGVGKVRVYMIASALGAMMNIPITFFFLYYLDLGVPGVAFATILSILPQSIALPIIVSGLVLSMRI